MQRGTLLMYFRLYDRHAKVHVFALNQQQFLFRYLDVFFPHPNLHPDVLVTSRTVLEPKCIISTSTLHHIYYFFPFPCASAAFLASAKLLVIVPFNYLLVYIPSCCLRLILSASDSIRFVGSPCFLDALPASCCFFKFLALAKSL